MTDFPNLNDLHICQIIPEMDTGGAERTVVEISEAIIAAGGKATIISQGGRLVKECEAFGATHITLPVASKNPLTMLANKDKIKKLAKLHGFDILHARSRAPAWSVYLAAKDLNIPFVTTYHGVYRAKNGLKRWYNSVMAKGDRVIANSDFTRENILDEHRDVLKSLDGLITIQRGADLRIFSPEHVAQADIDALGFDLESKADLNILLPGRLTSWKGQEILLKVVRNLQQISPEQKIRVILIGNDQGRDGYKQQLLDFIDEMPAPEMVSIKEHTDHIAAAYRWADLVISASTRPEAFGRVAIEASAMGRVVIATNHGGAKETIQDGVTGYLVAPENIDQMQAAIVHFSQLSPKERENRQEAARNRAKSYFSIDRMALSTLNVYQDLWGERGQKAK